MTILRNTPPAFDLRLIALFDCAVARAPQGWASPASYTVRTLQARDTKAADWTAGKLTWCYVEDIPELVAAALNPAAESDSGLHSELAAKNECIAALERKIAAAKADLQ